MAVSTPPRQAVLLTRISDDKAEDAKGVGRQEDDCRERADRLHWGIGEVVVENDTSAFKRRKVKLPDGTTGLRVVRPGFRRVLELLSSGQADGLLAYDLDRVARDPRDLEDLIDVIEQTKIPVESVTGSLRLSNDADITMARVMVAIANKSSRDTSRRVTRKHEQLASEGKPGGGGIRPYGYAADRATVIEHEAAIIREIARRLLDDESMYEIAADLNERGVLTVSGSDWSTRTIRSVVTKPRVAGLRSTGRDSAMQIVGPATWPAILDQETWEEVCAKLATRGIGSKNKLIRWLNGSLWHPACGAGLIGWQGNPAPRYWCATPRGGCGGVAINAAGAEQEIERQILDLLSKPRILEQLRGLAGSSSTREARAALADDEQQLKEMAGAYARRQITFAEYMEARKIVEARVRDARAMMLAAAPRILRGLLSGDVAVHWRDLEPTEKREVVMALVPDGWDVLPAQQGGRRAFDPARLRLRGVDK
ncbi:recombinase family protein [Kitasatospora sp. NBC_01302]|uniref:recombinase family protein n=1 Tax=Kitasatospora sp. NBC_01302 TaxID=2903575 RepID=UPI002E125F11|nr:recombinase family protein [Kitasatospora sp. NBC_01302]